MIDNKNLSDKQLNQILRQTGLETLDQYIRKYTDTDSNLSVSDYMTDIILHKGLRKKAVISRSGVSENLGYKLLNGTKTTTDRDKIIGLCIGAGMTVEETNRALVMARLGPLYCRSARDAVLTVGLQCGISSVIEMNELLGSRGFRLLNLHESREGKE
ncbi:MAG: hypothetical protein IJV59_03590 [Eubacterium sp.]|nr:hypothetical protein [Eubacterium sp.]